MKAFPLVRVVLYSLTFHGMASLLMKEDQLRFDQLIKGMNVRVLLDLKNIAEINEPMDQATLVFYVEVRHMTDDLLGLQLEANETECYLLSKSTHSIATRLHQFHFRLNSIEEKCFPELASSAAEVVACSDGQLVVGTFCKVTISTNFDMSRFPFDSQNLTTYFAHTMCGSQLLNVTYVQPSDNGSYFHMKNQEWDLLGYNCSRRVLSFPGDPISGPDYPVIECNVYIERNAWHYISQFCIPSSMIAAMSVVSVKGTFVGSGLKGPGFQIAVMSILTLCVLLLAASGELPPASVVTEMHIYYFSLIGILIATPMVNWGIWNLYHKHGRDCCWVKRLDVSLHLLLLAAITALLLWICF